MNPLEKFLKDILEGVKDVVPSQTTETDISLTKKKIQVELSEPPDPSNTEAWVDWQRECNARILDAIPRGYTLKSSEVKEVVRHYADLIVEKY